MPKNSNKESGRKKEPPGNTFSVEKAEVSEFINPSRPDLNVEREPPLLALCHPYDYGKENWVVTKKNNSQPLSTHILLSKYWTYTLLFIN